MNCSTPQRVAPRYYYSPEQPGFAGYSEQEVLCGIGAFFLAGMAFMSSSSPHTLNSGEFRRQMKINIFIGCVKYYVSEIALTRAQEMLDVGSIHDEKTEENWSSLEFRSKLLKCGEKVRRL